MKVMLALDGSATARKVLHYIVSNELLFRPEFEYTILCVSTHEQLEQAHREARPIVDKGAEFLHQQRGIVAHRAVRLGSPAQVISEFARAQHANLLVMGSHGHTGLRALVLGSVTQTVLATTSIPVLVVR